MIYRYRLAVWTTGSPLLEPKCEYASMTHAKGGKKMDWDEIMKKPVKLKTPWNEACFESNASTRSIVAHVTASNTNININSPRHGSAFTPLLGDEGPSLLSNYAHYKAQILWTKLAVGRWGIRHAGRAAMTRQQRGAFSAVKTCVLSAVSGALCAYPAEFSSPRHS